MSEEVEQTVDPTVSDVPMEEQQGEEFIADTLGEFDNREIGVSQEQAEPRQEKEPVEDSDVDSEDVETEEEVEEEAVEEEEPAAEPEEPPEAPTEEVAEVEPTESTDAEVIQEPEPTQASAQFRAILEQNRRLEEMLNERDSRLAEYMRQREEDEVEEVNFIESDDDVDEVLSSKEGLNKLLNKVYRRGVADSRERVLTSIDEDLDRKLRTAVVRRERAERFYRENPDLSSPELRKYTALVAADIRAETPEIAVEDFYAKLGPEVRKRLGIEALRKTTGTKAPAKPKKAAASLNRGSQTRPPTKRQKRTLADEVEENLF